MRPRQLSRRSGQNLVEFSLAAFLTVITMLFIVETGRMLLVYAAIANAAREGVRYAIVHGSTRTGNGSTGPSGPSANPAQVVSVIDNFAGTAPLSVNLLVVNVTYPNASNDPGDTVNVTVVYPYNPLITYFPTTLRLGSAAQGVIQF